MMRRFPVTVAVLIVALGFGRSANAQRDLPRFVERCLAGIAATADETEANIERICAKTVDLIEAKIAEGDREGAAMAAREGRARVLRAGTRGAHAIRDGIRRCLEIIRRHGGDRDAARVILAAGEAASMQIGRAVRACQAAIGEAMGERPPSDPPPRDPPPRDPPPRDPPPR